MVRILTLCFVVAFPSFANVSKVEQEEVSNRLKRFYQSPWKASTMSESLPKFNTETNRFEVPNGPLKGPKHHAMFQKYRCEKFFKEKDPRINCDAFSWEQIEFQGNDQPENLTSTWIPSHEFENELSRLPTKGSLKTPYWSGDYWAMNRGLTSYRYVEGKNFDNYRESIAAYTQPVEWTGLLEQLNIEALSKKTEDWSPAEKYDLLVGDTNFSLTNQQKHEGESHMDPEGDVESWFGICHGWAPAAVFVPPPMKKVETTGASGVTLTWYPDDIKAMATLAWASGSFATNFVGGRCDSKNIRKLSNGRIAQAECFDNNPSTFHRATANLLGKKGVPFIMDASYDYEVWNQPVVSYEFEYFNPLDTERKSLKWEDVAVNYDDKFKKIDRFQTPKTRGRRLSSGKYDDSEIKQVVGVIASVSYLSENSPSHSVPPKNPRIRRVTYTYDLEIHERDGKWLALGGEWHENLHPDFLWVPTATAVASQSIDSFTPDVDLKYVATPALTKVARSASRAAYPLCKVVKALINQSSESGGYECPL